MNQNLIDGAKLKQMFLYAAQFLEKNKQAVNSLNVFPVPDGDTGTNMSLTMLSAAREISALNNDDLTQVADALSRGSLKGARGNSGVILSQLFRGFANALKGEESINTVKYADAMIAGSETAYKAVMKPVEGTILTVARVTAEEGRKIAQNTPDFSEFFSKIIIVAKETLDNTPNLLPVLKQAGVVDSGGMGYLYILLGCAHALDEDFDLDLSLLDLDAPYQVPQFEPMEEESIEFGYCTEFFIKNLHPNVTEQDIDKLKEKLEKLGDSIVVVGDENLIKVHFHTNMPGKGLQLGLRFGELTNIKIDNMREQHRHINDFDIPAKDDTPEKEYGILSVSMGNGIASIFKDLNTDYIIEGGQTMNPSIEDILKGVARVKAKNLFILPNNSNIVLSASQAAKVSDKPLHVIPTKSIPQGLAALIAFNPDASLEENLEAMTEAISNVKTGQVTYAVRSTNINNTAIEEGDIIGISDGKIGAVGKNIAEVTMRLIDSMVDEDSEIVTIFYGKEASTGDTEQISSHIREKYPDLDLEVLDGGQPLYYYIISVE